MLKQTTWTDYRRFIKVRLSAQEHFQQIKCFLTQKFKLRSIVEGHSWETHGISNLLDLLLKLHVSKVMKFYQRYCRFFSFNSWKRSTRSYILVSFDVTNLYPNFQYELGLEDIEHLIDKCPELMIWPFLITFHPQKCKFHFGKQFN